MNLIDTIKNIFVESETEEPEDDGIEYQKDYQNVENMEGIDAIVMVMNPTQFLEAEAVSKHIKQGRAVIMCLENTGLQDRQRLIDFVSGVVMARDGMIAKIHPNVYLCAPKNIGVIEE